MGCLGLAAYHLLKLARIIMILEDDLSESIESLQASEQTLEELLKMQMFFDSKEVKLAVMEAMQDVKIAKHAMTGLIRKFTQRSKQKYVSVKVVEDEREEE